MLTPGTASARWPLTQHAVDVLVVHAGHRHLSQCCTQRMKASMVEGVGERGILGFEGKDKQGRPTLLRPETCWAFKKVTLVLPSGSSWLG